MKFIDLSQGYKAIVDDDDFERLNCVKWTADIRRRRDGTIAAIYAHRFTKGPRRKIYLHHEIIGSTAQLDHRDRNGLNNQRANLRLANSIENGGNQSLRRNNTSGRKGVSWFKRDEKWNAQIHFAGQHKNLGYFATLEEASLAYDRAAEMYYGKFAATNQTLGVTNA